MVVQGYLLVGVLAQNNLDKRLIVLKSESGSELLHVLDDVLLDAPEFSEGTYDTHFFRLDKLNV